MRSRTLLRRTVAVAAVLAVVCLITALPAVRWRGDASTGPCTSAISPLPSTGVVTVYEMTSGTSTFPFQLGGSALTTKLTSLGAGSYDFVGSYAGGEFYDIYVSDANGNPSANGSYLTIDTSFNFASDSGNNIDAVSVVVGGTARYSDTVASVRPGGGPFTITSASALGPPDGQATFLGNTPSSITLGFCQALASSTGSTDPIGWWKFDTPGTSATDSSGNGFNGTAYGNALASNGCMEFGGQGGVDVGQIGTKMPTNALTWSAWIKKSDSTTVGAPGAFFNSYSASGWGQGFWNATGPTTLWAVGGGGLTSQSNLQPNVFTHVAVTYDGSTANIYLNGTLDASGPVPYDVRNVPDIFSMGYRGKLGVAGPVTPITFFKGTMDDVRVYNRALTATEVSALASVPASCDASQTSVCGNGVCDSDEAALGTTWSCADNRTDCKHYCQADCGGSQSSASGSCGNGVCDSNETNIDTRVIDCAPGNPLCSKLYCPQDCGGSTASAGQSSAAAAACTVTNPAFIGAAGSPAGLLGYNKRTYLRYDTRAGSWSAARTACQAAGGDLVSINSSGEQQAVFGNLVGNRNDLWIGLSDSATEGTFVWTDGTIPTFTNWRTGQPDDGSANEDCAEMNYTGFARDGKWNDLRCSDGEGQNTGFLCELPLDCGTTGTIPAECKASYNGYKVNGAFPGAIMGFERHLYLQYLQNLAWTDAETKCTDVGGHLVALSSDAERDAVNALIGTGTHDTWIGMNDRATEGTYVWTTGELMSYRGFLFPGQPNNYDIEDCAVMHHALWPVEQQKYAGDYPCNQGFAPGGFVCELPTDCGTIEPPTGPRSSTPSTLSCSKNDIGPVTMTSDGSPDPSLAISAASPSATILPKLSTEKEFKNLQTVLWVQASDRNTRVRLRFLDPEAQTKLTVPGNTLRVAVGKNVDNTTAILGKSYDYTGTVIEELRSTSQQAYLSFSLWHVAELEIWSEDGSDFYFDNVAYGPLECTPFTQQYVRPSSSSRRTVSTTTSSSRTPSTARSSTSRSSMSRSSSRSQSSTSSPQPWCPCVNNQQCAQGPNCEFPSLETCLSIAATQCPTFSSVASTSRSRSSASSTSRSATSPTSTSAGSPGSSSTGFSLLEFLGLKQAESSVSSEAEGSGDSAPAEETDDTDTAEGVLELGDGTPVEGDADQTERTGILSLLDWLPWKTAAPDEPTDADTEQSQGEVWASSSRRPRSSLRSQASSQPSMQSPAASTASDASGQEQEAMPDLPAAAVSSPWWWWLALLIIAAAGFLVGIALTNKLLKDKEPE